MASLTKDRYQVTDPRLAQMHRCEGVEVFDAMARYDYAQTWDQNGNILTREATSLMENGMTIGKLQITFCVAGLGLYWLQRAGLFHEQNVPKSFVVVSRKWMVERRSVRCGTFAADTRTLGPITIGWFAY